MLLLLFGWVVFFDQICPKKIFPVENRKIALVLAFMVVTYYIKLYRTGADRHNGVLMSLLLLVAETMKEICLKQKKALVSEIA